MSNLLAMLVAALPNAIMAIAAKLFTEAFFQKILTKVLIAGARKAASMTTNAIDDELVEDIARALQPQAKP